MKKNHLTTSFVKNVYELMKSCPRNLFSDLHRNTCNHGRAIKRWRLFDHSVKQVTKIICGNVRELP